MGQLDRAHLGIEIVHTVMGWKQTQWQMGKSPSDVTRQREEQNTKESCTLDMGTCIGKSWGTNS